MFSKFIFGFFENFIIQGEHKISNDYYQKISHIFLSTSSFNHHVAKLLVFDLIKDGDFKEFIRRLNDILKMDKNYFKFIVTRLNSSVNDKGVDVIRSLFLKGELSLEEFNKIKEEFGELFKEIETPIKESIDTNNIYKDLQTLIATSLNYDDMLSIRKSGYGNVDIFEITDTIEKLYKLSQSKDNDWIINNMNKFSDSILKKITSSAKDITHLGIIPRITDIFKNPFKKWIIEVFYKIERIDFLEVALNNITRHDIDEETIDKIIDLLKWGRNVVRRYYYKNVIRHISEKNSDILIDLIDRLGNMNDSDILDSTIELIKDEILSKDSIDNIGNWFKVYDKLGEYLDMDITEHINELIINYWSDEDTISKLEKYELKGNIDWDTLTEERTDNKYYVFLYELYRKIENELPDNHVLLFVGYNDSDLSLEDLHKKLPKEKFSKEHNSFVFEIGEFSDLNEYYDDIDPFSDDDWDRFYYSRNDFRWEDGFSEINFENLLHISLIVINNDIELTSISKQELIGFHKKLDDIWKGNGDYQTKRKEKEILLSKYDKEIFSKLLKEIEEILNDDEDDLFEDLKDEICSAQARAQEEADSREFFDKAVSALPDIFMDVRVNGETTKYQWVDNKLHFYLDLGELLSDIYWTDYLYEYGLYDGIDSLIGNYFEQAGKITFRTDYIYGDINWDYFNEVLYDNINNQIPKIEDIKENIIIRFNSF
jgi:hypothetical protein